MERNIIVTEGQPYFAFQPLSAAGRPKFYSDLNLFWNCAGGDVPLGGTIDRDEHGKVIFKETGTVQEHLDAGRDNHSLFVDPKFRSPETGDFTIADDSPAISLGFKPIDTSNVGIRPKDNRD